MVADLRLTSTESHHFAASFLFSASGSEWCSAFPLPLSTASAGASATSLTAAGMGSQTQRLPLARSEIIPLVIQISPCSFVDTQLLESHHTSPVFQQVHHNLLCLASGLGEQTDLTSLQTVLYHQMASISFRLDDVFIDFFLRPSGIGLGTIPRLGFSFFPFNLHVGGPQRGSGECRSPMEDDGDACAAPRPLLIEGVRSHQLKPALIQYLMLRCRSLSLAAEIKSIWRPPRSSPSSDLRLGLGGIPHKVLSGLPAFNGFIDAVAATAEPVGGGEADGAGGDPAQSSGHVDQFAEARVQGPGCNLVSFEVLLVTLGCTISVESWYSTSSCTVSVYSLI